MSEDRVPFRHAGEDRLDAPREEGDGQRARQLDIRNPEDREAMIYRMKAAVADPRVSNVTRAKAERTLRNIQAIDRKAKKERSAMHPTWTRYATLVAASLLWCSLFAINAYLASARLDECWDELSGAQQDICLRHAMEGRDVAIVLAAAGPVLLIIGLILYRQLKAYRQAVDRTMP